MGMAKMKGDDGKLPKMIVLLGAGGNRGGAAMHTKHKSRRGQSDGVQLTPSLAVMAGNRFC